MLFWGWAGCPEYRELDVSRVEEKSEARRPAKWGTQPWTGGWGAPPHSPRSLEGQAQKPCPPDVPRPSPHMPHVPGHRGRARTPLTISLLLLRLPSRGASAACGGDTTRHLPGSGPCPPAPRPRQLPSWGGWGGGGHGRERVMSGAPRSSQPSLFPPYKNVGQATTPAINSGDCEAEAEEDLPCLCG